MTSYKKSNLCQLTHIQYLLEEQSLQLSPQSDFKWWSIRLFWSSSPQQEQQHEYRDGSSSWSKDKIHRKVQSN